MKFPTLQNVIILTRQPNNLTFLTIIFAQALRKKALDSNLIELFKLNIFSSKYNKHKVKFKFIYVIQAKN